MQTQQSNGSIGVCTNCNQKQATHVLSCGHLGQYCFNMSTLIFQQYVLVAVDSHSKKLVWHVWRSQVRR